MIRPVDDRYGNNGNGNGRNNQEYQGAQSSYSCNDWEENSIINDNHDDEGDGDADDDDLNNTNDNRNHRFTSCARVSRRQVIHAVVCLFIALLAIFAAIMISKQVQQQEALQTTTPCCACPNSMSDTTSSSSSSSNSMESCFCASGAENGSAIDLSHFVFDNSTVQFTISSQLCTLVQIAPDGNSFKPVARSYDGNPWEVSAGAFTSLVVFDCTGSSTCKTVLPSLPDGAIYQLRSFPRVYKSAADTIARFLEQATFGITRADIESFQGNDSNLAMAQWIQKQQNEVPITSHRQVYRQRLNARREVATVQGMVTHPCEAGARYRRYAFSDQDFGKNLTIDVQASNRTVISVDGFVRTVVAGPVTNHSDPSITIESGNYTFYCYYWSSYVGGTIVIEYHAPGNYVPVAFNFEYGNPIVQFEPGAIEPNLLLNIPSSGAVPIDTQYFQGHYQGAVEPMPEIILKTQLSDSICSNIGPTGNPIQPVYALFDGVYWIHDPRFETLENTLESPAMDGGGASVRETLNILKPEQAAVCANVPQTFVNEDYCVLSNEPTACEVGPTNLTSDALHLQLNTSSIRSMYMNTGNGAEGTRYVYAISGLRVSEDDSIAPPCEKRTVSRWIPVNCSGAADALDVTLAGIFAILLSGDDPNPILKDIYNWQDEECPSPVFPMKGFEAKDMTGNCWLHVHSDHMNVFDFTAWTLGHPGNTAYRNPIKEFGSAGLTTLTFPSNHTMDYWSGNKYTMSFLGRSEDFVQYVDLPPELRTPGTAAFFGFSNDDVVIQDRTGTVVCGSPFEVWNEPFLGGSQGRGAFDSTSELDSSKSLNNPVYRQKEMVWTHVALTAADQLRQRVAWALAQILVVSPASLDYGAVVTEELLVYYDIFVRHSFGNYRDILKEVSYSPVMAEMLTYYDSTSTAYVWKESATVSFADENYAREIMQLFTTGLTKLNPNGTQIIDEDGESAHVYSNDDIVEYARVWTGFQPQAWRGNIESINYNRVDPMDINVYTRDPYPKMGLDRMYIGDGVPLCADLPPKHFLKQGAVYRLLGSTASPHLQLADPPEWKAATNAKRLSLEPNGETSLFAKLCGSLNPARCIFEGRVVLDQDLPCSGFECSIDTIRTVEVADGIFYEYVRPPCVYQGFFRDAKTVVRRSITWDVTCADPRTEIASAACCTNSSSEWKDAYWGERMTFSSAQQRCAGQDVCTRLIRPSCDANDPAVGSYCLNYAHSWTDEGCAIRVKIDKEGNVAIAHAPFGVYNEEINDFVREDSKTFFRADWSGDVDVLIESCNATAACNTTSDGMCVCDVVVSDEQVYTDGATPNREEILSSLRIGAFDPSLYGVSKPSGSYDGIDWYAMDDSGKRSSESIFTVVDENGVRQMRRNMRSKVSISGTELSFRNPVHFISLTEPEPRDAHQETDAALDHYLYHPNTAPFLAIRFAQRFGISNPSPAYVEAISTAFRTGSFVFTSDGTTIVYGSGSYGDLASTIACVLLHREARNVQLDLDPSYGSLKEPLMKVIGLMKSLEFLLFENVPFVEFSMDIGSRIGQMAHEIPNVFSFFLPEYRPAGLIGSASLVSPEAQVLTGPRVIETLNGLLSLIRYGFTSCFGGLAVDDLSYCDDYMVSGDDERCGGTLRFAPSNMDSTDAITTELATLLTAGRLPTESREIINHAMKEEANLTAAIMKAQQLMVLTPEFHSTGISSASGLARPQPSVSTSNSTSYKALVYVLLEGGVDSYNVLVPHTCSQKNANDMTLLDQYNSERSSLAFTDSERSRIVDASGQPCSQFAIHQDLEIVERLYKEADLAFFANAGVLNTPPDKYNYTFATKTYLFAHNTMQEEADRVDPFRVIPRTGILGRLCDVLGRKGYSTQPIAVEVSTVATVGMPGAGRDRFFASRGGPSVFYPSREGEDFDPRQALDQLNGGTVLHSSLFGETWSSSLSTALRDSEAMFKAVANVEILTDFPDGDYSQMLKSVATLIASHEQRGTDRDVFYVRFGGFDHHQEMKTGLSERLKEVNEALSAFTDEMKARNVWDDVTTVITSDFGRTLTANSGRGSDHGWGGHYFAMGGSVKGGQIHGDYPSDITDSSPLNLGRGRIIPTMSWESILNPIFTWMGVSSDEDLNYCLPNRLNTGAKLLSVEEVFEGASENVFIH